MDSNFTPKFVSAKQAQLIYGINVKRLTALCSIGAVRTVKLGTSKQSGRIFHAEDIEHALLRLSEGKILRKKIGPFQFSSIDKTPKVNPS